MALKLLHTADWHLGMRFPSFPEEAQRTLMRARMSAVDRIFGLARSHAVDAVLCAGDLFDEPAPEPDWWQGLLARLGDHDASRCPVFLLPGNHDPLTPASVWHETHPFRRGLPAGVHVVDRDDFEAPLSEDAVLYAAPCRTAAGQTGLWQSLPRRAAGDARLRIGMIHGQTFDLPGCQTNFPIAAEAAEDRGLDYLAIGDTHAFRVIPPEGRRPMVYPSAPEPTRFGEDEAGFVALVFFPRGRPPHVRPERVGHWRWVERTVTSLAELASLAEDESLRRTVLRLRLQLRVGAQELDEVERILRTLKGSDASHGRVGVLEIDRSGLILDPTDLGEVFEDLPEVLAAAVARLRVAEAGERPEPAKRALYHLYRLVKELR